MALTNLTVGCRRRIGKNSDIATGDGCANE